MRTLSIIFGALFLTVLANAEGTYGDSSSYNNRTNANVNKNAAANYDNNNNWNNQQNSGQVNYSNDADMQRSRPSEDRWGNRTDRNDNRGSTYDNDRANRDRNNRDDNRYNRYDSRSNTNYDNDEMDEGNYIQSQRNRGQTGANEDKWSRTQRMYDAAPTESRARRY